MIDQNGELKNKMKDKVVIITGASSGIGKALAYEFASKGCKLVLAARRIELLEMLEKDLAPAKVLLQQTDVSIEADCKRLINATVERFGKIDILVNNAGISMRAIFEEVELDVLRKLMDVNFWGTVYCTKYALPYLLQTKGSLVGIISIAGYIGLPGRSGYSASKFAMRGFLDTVRTENLKKGLHVLVAAPGFTASEVRKTALTASGSQQGETPRNEEKMMSAEECARHIVHAVQKRKRQLILTFIEGKLSVFLSKFFPTLIDRLTFNHMAKEPDSPFK
jgi:short-subunit dehydrogenase